MSWRPFIQALHAATWLLIHTMIITVAIGCIYWVEELIKYLWGVHEPLLFGRLPRAYTFHTIDLGVLVAFGYRGILAAYKAFEE